MKTGTIYLRIFFIMLFVGGIMLTALEPPAVADSYAMVKITKMPYGLNPRDVKVKRGQTVIWINEESEPCKIKITTKVGIACKAPDNFYGDLFGYYETPLISQGRIAGICLIEKGEYAYEVKRIIKGIEEVSTGKIIVE